MENIIAITDRERDALLAALRAYELTILRGLIPDEDEEAHIRDIFTNGGRHSGLSADEIDALCERING